MKIAKMVVLAVLLTGFLAGTALAGGGELKKLGLKAYWSVLDEGQKEEAKEIFAVHLAETAPDRLSAASRLVQFKGDVAAVMTPVQRRGAWRISRTMKGLQGKRKAAVWDELLNGTDRGLLADRAEQIGSASPADRLELGYQMLDQVFAVLLDAYTEKLSLSADQRVRIEGLFAELKTDLRPTALRLAEARAQVTRAALSLLDGEQRAKLDEFKVRITEKILGFLRG